MPGAHRSAHFMSLTPQLTVATTGVNYDETNRTISILGTLTLPTDRYERYDIDRSVVIVSTVTTPTDRPTTRNWLCRQRLSPSSPRQLTVPVARNSLFRPRLSPPLPLLSIRPTSRSSAQCRHRRRSRCPRQPRWSAEQLQRDRASGSCHRNGHADRPGRLQATSAAHHDHLNGDTYRPTGSA